MGCVLRAKESGCVSRIRFQAESLWLEQSSDISPMKSVIANTVQLI